MLISLHAKNLALIETVDVSFEKGLNILTGETGAGKSIIIGSISLALGAKADTDMIRMGEDSGLVQLVFQANEKQKNALTALLDEELEDDTVIITRKLMPGKSVAKVNGMAVSQKQLREIAGVLLDLYGQREHQDLVSKKNHLDILDAYAEDALADMKPALSDAYLSYRKLLSEYEAENKGEDVQKKEIALAEFEYKEIEEAKLEIGEDLTLEQDFHKMENMQKIAESVSRAVGVLSSEDGGAATDLLGMAIHEMKTAAQFDGALLQHAESLLQMEDLLHDTARSLSDYLENAEFDEALYREMKARLDLLNKLKSKYGDTLEAVLAYKDELALKLEKWQNHDAYLAKLSDALLEKKTELLTLCKRVHEIRMTKASLFEKAMKQTLLELNFMDVAFEVRFQSGEDFLSAKGYDEIEFWISANPGEPLRPLQNVASGGELSRIMLAFKTVMAKKEEIGTLIFDEIDAGISGNTAWQVSEKLGILAKEHQIICITHLPQIAAMADAHYCIEKSASEGRTRTDIRKLSEEDGLKELARLLGSGAISDSALQNAQDMRRKAKSR